MNQNQPPANWYPDPDSSSYLRYWDGNAWTEHRTPLIQPVAKRTFKTGTTKISRILVPVSIVLWVAALWFVAYYPVVSRAGLSNDGITVGVSGSTGSSVKANPEVEKVNRIVNSATSTRLMASWAILFLILSFPNPDSCYQRPDDYESHWLILPTFLRGALFPKCPF